MNFKLASILLGLYLLIGVIVVGLFGKEVELMSVKFWFLVATWPGLLLSCGQGLLQGISVCHQIFDKPYGIDFQSKEYLPFGSIL